MVIDNDEMKKLGSMLFSQIEKLCDDTVLNDSGKLNNLIASGKELSELIQCYLEIQKVKIADFKAVQESRL